MAVSSGPSTPPCPRTTWHEAQPLRLIERGATLRVAGNRTRRRARKRLHVGGGLTRAALGQSHRRHFRARDAVLDDVGDRLQIGRMTQFAAQVRSGPALAVGAVAPGALRIEDLLAGVRYRSVAPARDGFARSQPCSARSHTATDRIACADYTERSSATTWGSSAAATVRNRGPADRARCARRSAVTGGAAARRARRR